MVFLCDFKPHLNLFYKSRNIWRANFVALQTNNMKKYFPATLLLFGSVLGSALLLYMAARDAKAATAEPGAGVIESVSAVKGEMLWENISHHFASRIAPY
jgi:hypothetical protein